MDEKKLNALNVDMKTIHLPVSVLSAESIIHYILKLRRD